MKTFLYVSILMVVLMIAPMALADTLIVYRLAGYFSGNEGEFTLSGNDLGPFQTAYAANTKDQGNFDPSIQSFSIERNELIAEGVTYNFKISSAAILGGIGGPKPDFISIGTAYLYYSFSQGTLAGYDYTPGAGRSSTAGLLQDAFWWLEDEGMAFNAANPFMSAVAGKFVNPKADNNQYPVMVLNLFREDDGSLGQDQIIVVPVVPEPATMLLLASGLVGLAGWRKKLGTM